ncbi:hypothetical protein HJC23_005711 [Cyclotella cryptica]|uniref:5'-nucleotidase n=1 Tax=Cyclotella cryptica TaxID=29204 RepID=A0ABD3QK70_9STRA|eukprot:CCRYP_006423-RA/>CCRYP_006423-RA protein AED:0.02 eAED:0.00 QI:0/-1/0/1/-1/1/1/0/608
MSDPATHPSQTNTRHHRLSLISVNDVYSFDDYDTTGSPRGGWSRASTLIKTLKERYTNSDDATSDDRTVLVTANGDVLGGSSLLQHSQGKVAVEVMNAIPVDLAVLGNHEFDYGDEVLMERIEESSCAWLGSNVYFPTESIVGKSSLADEHGYFPGVRGEGMVYNLSDNLKLGVFGLVTKQTPKISYPSPKVIFDADVVSVARKTAELLRSRGAQIIVAITHMSEAEDLLLASDKVAGVDLIIGGHEHEPLSVMVHRGEGDDGHEPGDYGDAAADGDHVRHNEGGILVFKCGMNAYWVGTVDLDIEYESVESNSDSGRDSQNIKVTSISTSWAMHVVSSRISEDSQVSEIVQRCRKETDERMLVASFGEQIASSLKLDDVIASIGKSNERISSILPLDTRMSSVRRREATGGNLVADAMHWLLESTMQAQADCPPLPMMAMINGGFIRADRLYQPGSDFRVRHLLKELPFPRGIVVLKLEGKHLRDAIGQQLKGSSRGPTGSYPHLSHNTRLVYSISSGEKESNEEVIAIHSLTVNGSEVLDGQKYLIAVTGFVADGSEGCTSWLHSTRINNPAGDMKMSCVLLKYLQQHPVIVPRLEGRVVKICQPV